MATPDLKLVSSRVRPAGEMSPGPMLVPTADGTVMLVPHTDDVEPESAHYRTSGQVILGMGLLAVALFAVTGWLNIELGFIDRSGVLGIALCFGMVGTVMQWIGDSRQKP